MIMSRIASLSRRNLLFLAAVPLGLCAQGANGLYDPQPPANSAYVRFLLLPALGHAGWQLEVDGKVRVSTLNTGEPSVYLILSAGTHQIGLRSPSGKQHPLPTIDALPGRATTMVLGALDSKPLVFDDKTSSNKLKAQLSIYHLGKEAPFDVLTADGQTKVFSHLAPSSMNSIAVNPVQVELIAAAVGDKTSLAKVSLNLTQGASYGLFLMPDAQGKLQFKATINQVERYSGK